MNVMKNVKALAGASLGGVIVSAFVTAGNYSGVAATISGLFTFVLLAGAALYSMDTLK